MVSSATSSARAEMGELRRLKSLLPPELQSWVTVEAATAVNPPLITCEELGKDQVEIQVDLVRWEQFALDQRNLLFWHQVARIQNDTIPRDGWEMAALAIGLGGAVGELWVQDGLLLLLALVLCGVSGWRLYQRNNSQKSLTVETEADEKAIALATRFGYSLPNAYKSLGSALKTLIEQTPGKRARQRFEERLQALKTSAAEAKARSKAMKAERERSHVRTPESRPYTP
jgi:Sec-independent protein translocase protein TatA